MNGQPKRTWKTEEIKGKIQSDLGWLERAVIAIYERQTDQEKRVGDTVVLNNVGFSAADASYLSYVARWLKSGRHLSGEHVAKTRRLMAKYSGQLTKIANGQLQEARVPAMG